MSTATKSPAKTALDAHTKIQAFADGKAKVTKRVVDTIEVNQFIRQGDVYLIRLKDKPKDFEKVTQNRQLAPGTTKGSRHVIADGSAVTIYAAPEGANFTQGPVLVATERFTLEHPEHAHFSLPEGTYGVRYQQEWTERDEVRRVRD